MVLNEPISSSSHWRIPTTSAAPRDTRIRRLTHHWRSLQAAVAQAITQIGGQTQLVARPAAHAFVAALLVGGVVVAPTLALAALVCLLAPVTAVRGVAPALIVLSLIWLTLAILGAHTIAEQSAKARKADHADD